MILAVVAFLTGLAVVAFPALLGAVILGAREDLHWHGRATRPADDE